MTMFILINTFDANARGRQYNVGASQDLGSVISCHYTMEAAEAADAKLQREVKRGHGKNAFMPTIIMGGPRRKRGVMVCAGDIEDIGTWQNI